MSKQERIITRWGLVVVGGHGPIVAGDEDGARRTSTKLVEFDPVALTGVTATGRPYRLLGSSDPAHAIRCVLSLWDIGNAKLEIVSPEEAVSRVADNEPFDFSEEEKRELAVKKMEYYAGEIRREMSRKGMEEKEAAELLGLDEAKLTAILAADPDGASPDDSDDAFLALIRLETRGRVQPR